jgi:hypothetical protein
MPASLKAPDSPRETTASFARLPATGDTWKVCAAFAQPFTGAWKPRCPCPHQLVQLADLALGERTAQPFERIASERRSKGGPVTDEKLSARSAHQGMAAAEKGGHERFPDTTDAPPPACSPVAVFSRSRVLP